MDIKDNSKLIKKGDTFIALGGYNHNGNEFIDEAISKGAKLVIANKGTYPIDYLITKDTHKFLCKYLKKKYNYLFKKIKLIGITGTNGKTTSAYLIYQALNKLGVKTAYIGTIGFFIKRKMEDLNNTTPDILKLYEMLLTCYKQNVCYVVMEVSSQALSMHRVDGLLFDYAMFTNLTQDHLDYHKTMNNYMKAKLKLLNKVKKTGKIIINIDDKYGKFFVNNKKFCITIGMKDANYLINDISLNDNSSIFRINNELYKTKLIGRYNVYNSSMVIVLLKEFGYSYTQISSVLSKVNPPKGRMEKIKYKNNVIVIDYAHTPDAVLNILTTFKEISKKRMIVVIGCGGNRDKQKRPIMANITCRYADEVIFTSDNPRKESVETIIKDMISGLEYNNYEIEIDRKKAIKKGINKLNNNDVLLILGKGHEEYQIIDDKVIPFSDKKIVLQSIKKK